jgi:hypothetical protein
VHLQAKKKINNIIKGKRSTGAPAGQVEEGHRYTSRTSRRGAQVHQQDK